MVKAADNLYIHPIIISCKCPIISCAALVQQSSDPEIVLFTSPTWPFRPIR